MWEDEWSGIIKGLPSPSPFAEPDDRGEIDPAPG
ncbi:hypothetical protein CEXT_247231, partial [Caerostris extrusa]